MTRLFCFFGLALVALLFALFSPTKAWRLSPSPATAARAAAAAVCAGGLSLGSPVFAVEADPAQLRAVEQVLRVKSSLKYVDETINTEGNTRAVVTQINLLLSNYKLKDNVRLSLPLVVDSARREEARLHGVAAVEDLQVVSEYFDDDINDTTGQKTPPVAVLKLALQATEAADKELKEFFALFPSEVISASKSKVEAEF